MSESITSLNIGVAGLGTVGVGVLKIIQGEQDMLTARTGLKINVTAVSARDRSKDRGVDFSHYHWCDNAVDLAKRDDVDVVVELMGGSDGPAYALAKETLLQGKPFVSANKALIAVHGKELAELSEANQAALKFEAAVAGGIPIVKALGEGLAGNQIEAVYGILNGTCNYILTRMEDEGLSFDEVLADAQKLGYAEADPTFDVDGIDTAHKTAILAAIAFGTNPSFQTMAIEGIRPINTIDIRYAEELGYRIKLLGIAKQTEAGIEQRVHPAMVPQTAALASVGGALNAVVVKANYVGPTVYEGAGAGEGPTASAVLADIIDVARGNKTPAFGVPASCLSRGAAADPVDQVGRFYVRLRVLDLPGVIADISTVLRDASVSIDSLIQRGEAASGGVFVVLTTHFGSEKAVATALTSIGDMDAVLESPAMIRIANV